MIQKIFSVFLLLSVALATAQENTSSQYSLHGIGIKRYRGTVANTSTGGISLFSNDVAPSILNAATYGDLKRTSFSVGGSYTSLKLEGNQGSQTVSNTTFDYLTVAIPTKYFGFGFGIVPHSSVGNSRTDIEIGEDAASNSDDARNTNQGSGDVNRVYFGVGAKVYKGLKLGAELRYNFGRLDNTILREPNDGEAIQTVEQTDVAGFTYAFSTIYDFKLKEKYILRTSYQLEGSNKHKFTNLQETANVRVNVGSDPTIDNANRKFIDIADREFSLPTISTFGLALIHQDNWGVAIETFIASNGNFQDRFKNREEDGITVSYKDGGGVRLGGYFLPNINSLTNYFSRINYRAGFRYENLGLQINNTEIKEFGISFGLGLPLPRGYSNLDLGVEFGARGENNNDAIKEQFINFSLGLNLSDKWFRKRKYD